MRDSPSLVGVRILVDLASSLDLLDPIGCHVCGPPDIAAVLALVASVGRVGPVLFSVGQVHVLFRATRAVQQHVDGFHSILHKVL